MSSVLDLAKQMKRYNEREIALALGWALNGSRNQILLACEDALEDWNHHAECQAVMRIRNKEPESCAALLSGGYDRSSHDPSVLHCDQGHVHADTEIHAITPRQNPLPPRRERKSFKVGPHE